MLVDFNEMQSEIKAQGVLIRKLYDLVATQKNKSEKDHDDPMSIKQASKFLNVPVSTIYYKKDIPRHRRGKRLFFFRTELIDYINKGTR